MTSLFSPRLAGKLLLGGLIALALFHILVMIGVLPSGIVWAGQVENSAPDLLMMEAVSLVVTLLFILIVMIRLGYVLAGRLQTFTRICLWLIGAFFLLSMVGNLASDVVTEKVVMAPFAFIMAILSFRLAATKQCESGSDHA